LYIYDYDLLILKMVSFMILITLYMAGSKHNVYSYIRSRKIWI